MTLTPQELALELVKLSQSKPDPKKNEPIELYIEFFNRIKKIEGLE